LGDLLRDPSPWSAARDERTDEFTLLAHVIEVEDAGIALTTVDAGMRGEESGHPRSRRRRASVARHVGLSNVNRSPAPEVITEAIPAPVLQPCTRAVERGRGKFLLAAPADLAPDRHERMFACAVDGSRV
jgi:hypothetical protein